MFYHFDIDKWALQTLPPFLRRPVLLALLKAMLCPLKRIYGEFSALKAGADRTLAANAFTGALEHHLNEFLLQPDGTVKISDLIDKNRVYLAFRDEIADTVYLGRDGDTFCLPSTRPVALKGAFVISIPEALNTPESIALISREVSFYKYAGTEFTIKTY